MLRKPLVLLFLLVLAAIDISPAQVARQDTAGKPQSNPWGNWSATNGGSTLTGTWIAVFDSASGTVTGTWTLLDPQGKTVAGGAWSAAKSPTAWNGAWRAAVSGSDGEYSGTWMAGADLKGDARLVDLFEKAIEAAVSGTWRAGSRSGAWSIRAAKREGTP